MEALQKLYDFREVELPEALFALTWDPETVEAEVQAVRERFLTIVPVDTAEMGDFATFKLPAQGEQKEKMVQVNIGKHFYDAAFEDSLVGLSVGAEVTMPAREGNRTGVLVSLKGRKLAELSDELIVRMHLEGVHTIADYREMHKQKLIAQDKQKKNNGLYMVVSKKVRENSVFGDLASLIAEKLADYESQLRSMAEAYGMSYEELRDMNTPPQYDTPEKKEACWQEKAETDVKNALIAKAYASERGKVFTQADYEKKCQEYLDMGVTQEQLDRQFSYKEYLHNAPLEYYQQQILAYFDNRFKVVEPV